MKLPERLTCLLLRVYWYLLLALHAREMHAYEVHVHEVYAHEVYHPKTDAYETHA
jgi:hypothetical protein